MAREVNLRVGIDARKAGTGANDFKKASNSLIKDSKRVEGSFSNLAKGVVALGISYLSLQTLKTATTAFIAQEKAVNQLEAVLKSTEFIAGRTSEQIQELASSLQRVTTVGDETTLEIAKLVLTFKNIRGEIFDRTLPAIIDISTALGTDLRSSAIQVAKALNDPITGLTALTRSGVTFTQAQKDVIKELVETNKIAEAQKIILEELESQSKGTAEAYRNTFGGSIIALTNAFGDLLEAITGVGVETTGAVGLIQRLEKIIVGITEGLNNSTQKIKDFISTISFLYKSIMATVSNLRSVIIVTLGAIVKEVGNRVTRIFDSIKNFMLNTVKALVTGLNALVFTFFDGYRKIFNGLGTLADKLNITGITKFFDAIDSGLSVFSVSENTLESFENKIESLKKSTNNLLKSSEVDWKEYTELIKLQFGVLFDDLDTLWKQYLNYLKPVNLGIIEIIGNAVEEVSEKARSWGQAFREELFLTNDKVDEFGKSFTNSFADSLIESKNKFSDFVNFVLRELLRLQIQKRITDPITSSINNFLSGTTTEAKKNIASSASNAQTDQSSGFVSDLISNIVGSFSFGSIKQSSKGNTNITVNNNTSSQVETTTSTNAQGEEQIQIAITNAVRSGFNNGSFDNELSQFGVSRSF